MRLPPADVPRRHERRDGRAGDHRGHRADVGAQAAPGQREREHRRLPTAKPHTRARGEAVASAPPSPSRPTAASAISSSLPAPKKREPSTGFGPEQRAARRAPSRARGRPRAAPTATAAGRTSARGHGRVRSVARASAAHATATISPSTGADGASPPVSSSTLGSHIAASRTTRPGSRASRRASPASPAIATAPINPSQITAQRRGPRSVSRLRSSERSAGLASPARLDRLSRHVVGDRRRRAARARWARRRWS